MSYPGGKGGCYHHIISEFPVHDVYIELFAGNASVFRMKKRAALSILVEKNKDVYAVLMDEFEGEPGVIVIHGDAFEFLVALQHRCSIYGGSSIVVYLDPPYLPEVRCKKNIYGSCELDQPEHLSMLDLVLQIPAFVAISGYPSRLYDKHLIGWRIKTFTAATRGRPRLESLWMNFSPLVVHDCRYVGRNFTDRQRIKRKCSRLLSMPDEKQKRKIAMLERAEKHVFLSMRSAGRGQS